MYSSFLLGTLSPVTEVKESEIESSLTKRTLLFYLFIYSLVMISAPCLEDSNYGPGSDAFYVISLIEAVRMRKNYKEYKCHFLNYSSDCASWLRYNQLSASAKSLVRQKNLQYPVQVTTATVEDSIHSRPTSSYMMLDFTLHTLLDFYTYVAGSKNIHEMSCNIGVNVTRVPLLASSVVVGWRASANELLATSTGSNISSSSSCSSSSSPPRGVRWTKKVVSLADMLHHVFIVPSFMHDLAFLSRSILSIILEHVGSHTVVEKFLTDLNQCRQLTAQGDLPASMARMRTMISKLATIYDKTPATDASPVYGVLPILASLYSSFLYHLGAVNPYSETYYLRGIAFALFVVLGKFDSQYGGVVDESKAYHLNRHNRSLGARAEQPRVDPSEAKLDESASESDDPPLDDYLQKVMDEPEVASNDSALSSPLSLDVVHTSPSISIQLQRPPSETAATANIANAHLSAAYDALPSVPVYNPVDCPQSLKQRRVVAIQEVRNTAAFGVILFLLFSDASRHYCTVELAETLPGGKILVDDLASRDNRVCPSSIDNGAVPPKKRRRHQTERIANVQDRPALPKGDVVIRPGVSSTTKKLNKKSSSFHRTESDTKEQCGTLFHSCSTSSSSTSRSDSSETVSSSSSSIPDVRTNSSRTNLKPILTHQFDADLLVNIPNFVQWTQIPPALFMEERFEYSLQPLVQAMQGCHRAGQVSRGLMSSFMTELLNRLRNGLDGRARSGFSSNVDHRVLPRPLFFCHKSLESCARGRILMHNLFTLCHGLNRHYNVFYGAHGIWFLPPPDECHALPLGSDISGVVASELSVLSPTVVCQTCIAKCIMSYRAKKEMYNSPGNQQAVPADPLAAVKEYPHFDRLNICSESDCLCWKYSSAMCLDYVSPLGGLPALRFMRRMIMLQNALLAAEPILRCAAMYLQFCRLCAQRATHKTRANDALNADIEELYRRTKHDADTLARTALQRTTSWPRSSLYTRHEYSLEGKSVITGFVQCVWSRLTEYIKELDAYKSSAPPQYLCDQCTKTDVNRDCCTRRALEVHVALFHPPKSRIGQSRKSMLFGLRCLFF